MLVRHILVATDFSTRAEPVLSYAVGLAELLSADIDLLHVVPAPPKSKMVIDAYLNRSLPVVSDEVVDEATRKLDRLLASVPHERVRVGKLVEPGDAAATIVRIASELPSDLIVVGTHGRIGLAELVLGSVAHRVVTCAPCPVVVMREDSKQRR